MLAMMIVSFHHNVFAAQTQIFSGPVSQAMGGGGRAGIESTEKLFINPAAAALGDGFEVGAHYRDGYWANKEHETAMGIVMLENDPENYLNGGFGYLKKFKTAPQLHWQEEFILASMGKTFATHWTLGASVYKLTQSVQRGPKYETWNGGLGLIYSPDTQLGFAYVLMNPVAAADSVPDDLKMHTQHSVAINFLFPELLRLTVDYTFFPESKFQGKGILQIGDELKFQDFFVLRTGFEMNNYSERHSLTGGIGFIGPRLKLNYSVAKPLKETNGAMHSVDLRLPF